ncbi:vacuolar aminopeptidase 1 [Paecilomyces lecythidis]|uniref:Vacuolar aminopeptidase 1 n=1 Tax=Paecilomyces lecythidis TaxID=3004212 RepID=A0ABR3WUN2_9EURO
MTKKRVADLQASVSTLRLDSDHPSQARYIPVSAQSSQVLPPRPSQPRAAVNSVSPDAYSKPFCEFMSSNPTIFHAVEHFAKQLEQHGYKRLSEREVWTSELKRGGKYYTTRNGSALIAFAVGKDYKSGNGVGIVAGHIDALTAKLKPVSKLPNKAGFRQLGVAPYAGALNSTWWDRDLSLGGRVLVRDSNTGKVETKLVKLDWPIARIPTLAPHFGAASQGPFNQETQMVPIIGVDNSDLFGDSDKAESRSDIPSGTFAATQPEKLVKVVSKELGITDYSSIVNWELELFDSQPAQLGGLEKDLIFAGRIDDKLCCYAAQEALLASPDETSPGIVKMVGMFDDEEVGSLLRQGARSNFMSSVIERIAEAFAPENSYGPNLLSQTVANSFLVSSDVIHSVNPNFLNVYLENHAPRLNVGVAVSADPNGHMTTDSVSSAILHRVADKCGSTLQVFQIRNDSRSGGTIGPMTSARIGLRAIDAGIPQLSMHSIRATTGSLDPGLGVKIFKGFFDYFEEVDAEFQDF